VKLDVGGPELRRREVGAQRFGDPAKLGELLGDEVVDHLVTMGEHELAVYEREVTDVERRREFECA
jgi:glutamine synthetase